jgi:predicted HicB family RNase H-like nuclease
MRYNARMSPRKSANLNLRIDPLLKEAAREAANLDQRSLANLIEVLIRKHCRDVGIPVAEPASLFKKEDLPDG